EMDRLFDEVFGGLPTLASGLTPAPVFPALNVWEDADHVYVEAELPGLKLDDVELLVAGDELTLKGQRTDSGDQDVTYHRKERGTGRFSRALRLPVEVTAGEVDATLRDGVLRVTLPKAEEVRPRKVEVKALPR
ncbi:MAG: Hsp20/alpha crystallin family protein, partial [Phycisphaerae bacterium]